MLVFSADNSFEVCVCSVYLCGILNLITGVRMRVFDGLEVVVRVMEATARRFQCFFSVCGFDIDVETLRFSDKYAEDCLVCHIVMAS